MGKQETASLKAKSALRKSSRKQKEANQDTVIIYKKPTMKARKAQAARPSNAQSSFSAAKPKEAIPKPTLSHKALLDTRRSSVDSQASTAVDSVQTASSVTLSGREATESTTAKTALPSSKPRRSLLPSNAYGNKVACANPQIAWAIDNTHQKQPFPGLSQDHQQMIMQLNCHALFSSLQKESKQPPSTSASTPATTIPPLPTKPSTVLASAVSNRLSMHNNTSTSFAIQELPPRLRIREVMAQYGFGTEAAAKESGKTTGPGPKGTSSNPSAPSASMTKKSGVATKGAGAAGAKESSTLDTTKASTSVMKGVGALTREKSAAQKLAQDLFPEDAQIIGRPAQTAGKKRKVSSSAPDTAARGKRARTSDLPCEDVVNVWLARLRSLTKGKRMLNRAELGAVSDALDEVKGYELPFAFVEESGLLAAVDQVVQMAPADIPGGDEHKLCRRAEALFESWIV